MTEPPDEDLGELLVLQHATVTGPSALTEVLDARAGRRPWRLVDLGGGAVIPPLDRARGLLLLGGPMSVHDRDEHRWIDAELDTLREARERGIPVFGICLGLQLLTTAFGGRVAARETPEIGFIPLQRTPAAHDDPVFAGWPDGAAALFSHDDGVVELPDGGVAMLEGNDGLAAWRAPDGASYGVQFHPEVDAAQVAAWAGREGSAERYGRAGVDPNELVVEAQRRDRFHRAVGLSLVGRWLDAVVGKDDPDPRRGRRARA